MPLFWTSRVGRRSTLSAKGTPWCSEPPCLTLHLHHSCLVVSFCPSFQHSKVNKNSLKLLTHLGKTSRTMWGAEGQLEKGLGQWGSWGRAGHESPKGISPPHLLHMVPLKCLWGCRLFLFLSQTFLLSCLSLHGALPTPPAQVSTSRSRLGPFSSGDTVLYCSLLWCQRGWKISPSLWVHATNPCLFWPSEWSEMTLRNCKTKNASHICLVILIWESWCNVMWSDLTWGRYHGPKAYCFAVMFPCTALFASIYINLDSWT